ncbi:MAG: glycosyltransferase family 9 protein [Agromyces sp.]|jgi:ADP-heptose:LPS heptosyltransferase|nr:glycosyltransferase family 9 protein [Agromyces sp.]
MHVATTRPPFEDIRRIAVLRGGGLGDLLFAMPAMEALAAAYPDAEIVLLGSPSHRALLEGRPSPVARVEELPIAPGIREEAGLQHDDQSVAEFRRRVLRAGTIDLGVQLHGGGRNSNPFVLALEPRHTVGSATPDAPALERTLPYAYYQHEVMRGLEVAGLAGARPVTLEPRIQVTERDRVAASPHLPAAGDRPFVAVHPGATDPRRRWPVEHFAHVVTGLLDVGATVALLGDDGDRASCAAIADRVAADRPDASARVTDASGRLPIGTTAAILEAADVVVANDSGPRHLAQAVGAATVGIFWFGNVINAAPFGRERHRVHLSFTVRCPVCDVDVTQVGWTAPRCEHDESFVADVDPAAVLDDALDLTARSSPLSAPRAVPGSRSRRAG